MFKKLDYIYIVYLTFLYSLIEKSEVAMRMRQITESGLSKSETCFERPPLLPKKYGLI